MQDLEVRPVNSFYSKYIKRILDIILSSISILVLSPVFVVVICLELIYHGKPVFYCTSRPGKDGKIFKLYKFRSMTNERDENGYLLPESERLTGFGRFIRKTSIDELPELFNIFKGDMSIIGPRPLLVEYLNYYSPRHSMRHAVRPGFACFRIVESEKKTWTWRDQFENDIWYVEHLSLLTDVKMIFAVFREVLKASDVRENDDRPPFTGDNLDETRNKSQLNTYIRFDSITK